MKGIFRKIRGHKSKEPVQTQSSTRAPPAQASSRRPPDLETEPNKLSCTSSVPLDQLLDKLRQPATGWAQDTSHLVKVHPKSQCPICWNLIPQEQQHPEEPRSRETSWAHDEFILPNDTPISVITVEDSSELVKSARGGCIFCTIVDGALGAVHPGWEQEKTFIHIHLAAGLPVVVRLQFGTTSTLPLRRDEAASYGVDLAEGQTMNFVITVCDSSRPAIEVEIYRPSIPIGQLTVAGESVAS